MKNDACHWIRALDLLAGFSHTSLIFQNWEAYLERPDGSVELLESYRTKPPLNEVAKLVRETSFKRYAINNDRFAKGFGARL